MDDPDKPLVYMVDELDRCRPTFAISVLERIKHLLNVPGVVFVFAWDRQQLNRTIHAVYGTDTDASGYLLRFVDLEMNLPRGDARTFCHTLMERFGLREHLECRNQIRSAEAIERAFPKYAERFELTVRDQEKAFVALSICFRVGIIDDPLVVELLLLLITCRLKRYDLYNSICHIEKSYERLIGNDLPEALGEGVWQSVSGGMIEGCLMHTLPRRIGKQKFEELQKELNATREEKNRRKSATWDGYVFAGEHGRGDGGIVSDLFKLLEFTGNF